MRERDEVRKTGMMELFDLDMTDKKEVKD